VLRLKAGPVLLTARPSFMPSFSGVRGRSILGSPTVPGPTLMSVPDLCMLPRGIIPTSSSYRVARRYGMPVLDRLDRGQAPNFG
jgi:hypothetical protein